MPSYIYIDDSGTSGNISPSKHIDTSRVVWGAVILTSDLKFELELKIKNKLGEVNRCNNLSLNEFHFTNIYSGKKDFEGIHSDIRLEIIQWFVDLYNEFTPYVLAASCDKDTFKNSGLPEVFRQFELDGFSFCNPKDFSLWLLLVKCQDYLLKNRESYSLPAEIYIDSGRQKPGSKQNVSSISDICENGKITYCCSDDSLIQFIDFLVFTLNRIQNNLVKSRRPFDEAFLKIVGQMNWNSELQKIAIQSNNLSEYGVSEYDNDLDIILRGQGKIPTQQITHLEHLCNGINFMREILKNSPHPPKNLP